MLEPLFIDFYMQCLRVYCGFLQANNFNVCDLHLHHCQKWVIYSFRCHPDQLCLLPRRVFLFIFGLVIRLPSVNFQPVFSLAFVTDYDPQVIEQKEQSRPACLPLSYVLRFITDAARKEGPFLGTSGAELKRKLAIKHHSYSMTSSNRSLSPTGKDSHTILVRRFSF